ncbi:hypothetical protein RRG08_008297 [Elysia crispata]|uniref:Uncharacterized protein n=1 Tax=Elysia crispata TaxID=231223 RepID=A0AAE0ZMC1_9GAST|nr:hypothetical protein RRG08_008297 [Elysia crispata]
MIPFRQMNVLISSDGSEFIEPVCDPRFSPLVATHTTNTFWGNRVENKPRGYGGGKSVLGGRRQSPGNGLVLVTAVVRANMIVLMGLMAAYSIDRFMNVDPQDFWIPGIPHEPRPPSVNRVGNCWLGESETLMWGDSGSATTGDSPDCADAETLKIGNFA